MKFRKKQNILEAIVLMACSYSTFWGFLVKENVNYS
jgi:hypothetical protein